MAVHVSTAKQQRECTNSAFYKNNKLRTVNFLLFLKIDLGKTSSLIIKGYLSTINICFKIDMTLSAFPNGYKGLADICKFVYANFHIASRTLFVILRNFE